MKRTNLLSSAKSKCPTETRDQFPFPATHQRSIYLKSCIGVSHGFYTRQVNLFIAVKEHFSHISVETDLLQKGDFSNCFQESRCAVSQPECYSVADYSKRTDVFRFSK